MVIKDAMYGMALRMGIPPDDAADVTQNTLIGLWRSRDGIPKDPRALRMYCLKAMRNNSITFLKKSRRHERIEDAEGIVAPPGADTEYRDTACRIEVLLGKLTETQERVIRLSAFADMDNADIAEVTGESEANVRQLLSRGRRRLQELIKFM